MICPDDKTAAFYQAPRVVDLRGLLYQPTVLVPSQVPAILDPAEIAADPVSGLVSLAFHAGEPAQQQAFATGISTLPADQARLYRGYASALTPLHVRKVLEDLMKSANPVLYSEISKKDFADGRTDGQRRTLRAVLEARDLTLTKDQSAQVDACTDPDTLERWSKTAATATDAGDIFA